MEKRVNTDVESLKFIYRRNKYLLVPGIVIMVSILVVLLVIIPQVQAFLAIQDEAKNAQRKLEGLKNDLNMLKALDEEILNTQLRTTTKALPVDKDFAGVLNAIFFAAQRTGVRIGRFSFQVGEISGSEENTGKLSSINLSVSLDSNISAINNFIQALQETVPLSSIDFIRTDNMISTVEIEFYYKIMTPPTSIENIALIPLTNEKMDLYEKIVNFNNSQAIDFSNLSVTPSARTTNPFGN